MRCMKRRLEARTQCSQNQINATLFNFLVNNMPPGPPTTFNDAYPTPVILLYCCCYCAIVAASAASSSPEATSIFAPTVPAVLPL